MFFCLSVIQAPVVRNMDNTFHQINCYPIDREIFNGVSRKLITKQRGNALASALAKTQSTRFNGRAFLSGTVPESNDSTNLHVACVAGA